jgi:cold shock CspA family protein
MPQGTIKSWNAETGSAVLLDDGLVEHPVDKEAFAASGLLELRIGQRVRYEIEEDAAGASRVTNLNIISL